MSTQKQKLNKLAIFLIPIGIAVNVVGGQLAVLLKLPVFLDSIGTFVVGALCGWGPGMLVGLGCGLINAISLPTLLPYTVIGMLFGVLANFMAKKGLFSAFWKAPLNGIVIGIISTCIAVPITATLYGGFVGSHTLQQARPGRLHLGLERPGIAAQRRARRYS